MIFLTMHLQIALVIITVSVNGPLRCGEIRQALTDSTPMLFDLVSTTPDDLLEQDTINKVSQSFCDHIFDTLYPMTGN